MFMLRPETSRHDNQTDLCQSYTHIVHIYRRYKLWHRLKGFSEALAIVRLVLVCYKLIIGQDRIVVILQQRLIM
jgi:hypothetical protein